MKIIALMPVKNEEWILDITIPQLKKFVDEILVLDVASTDNTKKILENHNVLVKDQPYHPINFSIWRQNLLNWGRERGGTHFVWLDADEAFTTNLLPLFSSMVQTMQPGQKLVFDWLCLWKSPFKIRNDNSVWSFNYKDIVYCDDQKTNFIGEQIHEARTPGTNNENTLIKIPREQGAILHFQFVSSDRFQIKQAFQRCRELSFQSKSPLEINQRYAITLDSNDAECIDTPQYWISGINHLSSLAKSSVDWYYPAILKLFDQKGIIFFEPLQIWHIESLYNEFIKLVGRKPKPIIHPPLATRIKQTISFYIPSPIKNKFKDFLRKS